ncbi:MAG: tRNA (adenosine(37)-N6)-threonylcarbamoyltransferase complex dimerization subunit type 1 TsaB [Ferruginibacter sp.]
MGLILNIDTAVDTAMVSLAKNGATVDSLFNSEQKEHGGFLQPAIQTLLKNNFISIKELDAIATSAGPGSYTGLRVSMSTAKGLCYALDKPLITISTLKILALSAILQAPGNGLADNTLLCPMIDARRMEVFTALYNWELEIVLEPCALVLDENSFANSLLNKKIFFFGNGAKKMELLCTHANAVFSPVLINPLAMSKLSEEKYQLRQFADLAYSEPIYLKEFFTPQAKK